MDTSLRERIALRSREEADGGESVDARLISVLRCMLALSGQLIAWLDPEPVPFAVPMLAALSLYSAYSVALSVSIFRGRSMVPQRWQPWIDVATAAALIALTQAVSSVFFHFFFFAILVASFTRGYREGFAMTITATLAFIAAEYFLPSGPDFELDRLLIRPVYLLLLGYMFAYWGGQEIQLRRRAWLLKEIGSHANPRLGVQQTIAMHLRRLVAHFEADGAILVWPRLGSSDTQLYRIEAKGAYAPSLSGALPEAAKDLLEFPPGGGVAFNRRGNPLSFALRPIWHFFRPRMPRQTEALCVRIANLLETDRFLSVPLRQHQSGAGRVYLCGGPRPYVHSDAEFLSQAVDQISTAVDNVTLLEDLMRNAASLERSRISRDIHDTTMQPYIGLKIGLEALHRNVPPGTSLEAAVRDLIDMTGHAISDTRTYIAGLRDGKPAWPADNLVASLRAQVRRYRDYYGIEIDLRLPDGLQLTDVVASEAYQIICEGLSNVYRHTDAKKAFVALSVQAKTLVVQIGNEDPGVVAFIPLSISDRVTALRGTAKVSHDGAYTVVEARIPL